MSQTESEQVAYAVNKVLETVRNLQHERDELRAERDVLKRRLELQQKMPSGLMTAPTVATVAQLNELEGRLMAEIKQLREQVLFHQRLQATIGPLSVTVPK